MGGKVLLVSQFTLYGDCSRGYRPGFTDAARPEKAVFDNPVVKAATKIFSGEVTDVIRPAPTDGK